MQSARGLPAAALLLFLIGVVYALGLQILMRPHARDGIYFQRWSSDDMMQTVALGHLREEPLDTLLYIHIQPPAFDTLRAILAAPLGNLNDEAAVRRVDQSLYLVGALLLGLLVAVTYVWLQHYGAKVAAAGAIVLLMHPAAIYFATFLDSTLLSSLLLLSIYYALWTVKNGKALPPAVLSLLTLSLFFTRSIFQFPFIVLIIISLYLLGLERRRLFMFAATTCLVAGAFLVKQQVLFGMLSTSSFSGISLANSIGIGLGTEGYESYLTDSGSASRVDPSLPAVMKEPTKPNGRPNFNHAGYLDLNRALLARYAAVVAAGDKVDLARSYLENALIYFMPTSTYDRGHVIAEALPWRFAYNAMFSAPVLPILLVLALGIWLADAVKQKTTRQGAGLLLPAVYVFALSVLADKGENMRFKFWLEPIMWIFLISQLRGIVLWLERSRRRELAGV